MHCGWFFPSRARKSQRLLYLGHSSSAISHQTTSLKLMNSFPPML
eukprot:13270.XXX_832135_832269_1 [CDS] Oithona nana genome sequencing.